MEMANKAQRALHLFRAWMHDELNINDIEALRDIADDEDDTNELRACEDALATISSYQKGMK